MNSKECHTERASIPWIPVFILATVKLAFPQVPLLGRMLVLTSLAGSFTLLAPLGIQLWANWSIREESQQIALQRLRRTQAVMGLLQERIETHLVDYATWTEMWEFVQNPDPAWAAENLQGWARRSTGADLALVFSAKGELIYQWTDPQIPPLTRAEQNYWQQLLQPYAQTSPQLTYWQRQGKVYLVTWISITTSQDIERTLPSAGIYWLAVPLDQAWLQQLRNLTLEDYLLWGGEQTLVATTLQEAHQGHHLPDPQIALLFQQDWRTGPSRGILAILKFHPQSSSSSLLPEDPFSGFIPLPDPSGRLAGLLQVHFTLPSWYFIPFDLKGIWLLMLAIGILFCGVSSWLLSRWVLVPVSRMHQAVCRFQRDPQAQWDSNLLPRGDVLGELSFAFGQLVSQLQQRMRQESLHSKILSLLAQSNALSLPWAELGSLLVQLFEADQLLIWHQEAEAVHVLASLGWSLPNLLEISAAREQIPDWEKLSAGEECLDSRTAGIPLWVGDQVWGALWLQRSAQDWQPEAYGLLQQVGDQLAIVLEKQQLNRQTQQQAQQLQQYNQTLEDWISALAHDMRNPLFSQRVALTTLQKRLGSFDQLGDPTYEKVASSLESSLATNLLLSNLVENLLDIARYRAGRKHLNYQLLDDWQPLIQQALQVLAEPIQAKSLRVTVHIDPDLPSVAADAGEIYRVIQNLLENAVRFSPYAGQIQLRLERDPQGVRFSCQDQGEGIPAAEQVHLFQRFYQAGRSSSKGGTGMGLYLCRQIVESHGGQIGLDSQLGKGSTFWFTLPVADSRCQRSPQVSISL